jgi:putative sporulation protein YtxC
LLESISIGATEHIDTIKYRLDKEFSMLSEDGIEVELNENNVGTFTFLGCNIANYGNLNYSFEDTQSIFRHYVANVVSDVIISDWESKLLWDLIMENYFYFNEAERMDIYLKTLGFMNHGEETNAEYQIYQISRKSKVLQKILEFLQSNNEIVIEGFIQFRLKEYIGELQEAVDKAVEEFMMEREYKEFIRLLKYFVEIQEPRMEKIHVMIKNNGVFKLCDDQDNPVNSDYLENYLTDLIDNEINYEDLLISALITIAPSKIVIHLEDKSLSAHTVNTIKSVFESRVEQCQGCEKCTGVLDS